MLWKNDPNPEPPPVQAPTSIAPAAGDEEIALRVRIHQRLLDILNRRLGLSELPDRHVNERDHQHGDRDNRAQNACYFFRFHLDIPRLLLRF